MSDLPKYSIYDEVTAAQLLLPRVESLSQDGGINYKELNKRIVADNKTEGIPVDHNPIYGGINKEVCAIERQESFTINDKTVSFDKTEYTVNPKTVVIKTTEDYPTIVTSADKFTGDPITINVNNLLEKLHLTATKTDGEFVTGTVSLDTTKLIIDESIKNPFNIDFSNKNAILLKITPAHKNTIPVVFKPDDNLLHTLYTNISIMVVDQRVKAVVPKVSNGSYLEVASLNETNASSAKNCGGKLTTNDAAVFHGNLINTETNEVLSSVTCEVEIGTIFPANPTTYQMRGSDYIERLNNTLFATATLKQADMHNLVVVLPIVYTSDNRPEAVSFSSFDVEQLNTLELTYENSGYSFRGEMAVVNSDVLSDLNIFSGLDSIKDSDNNSVTASLGDVIVEKSINLNQLSTKAHTVISFEDVMATPMKLDVNIKDKRPFKAKEIWSVDADKNSMSVTIDGSAFNAGSNGQEWTGILEITGSIAEIHNQFGRVIDSEEFVVISGKPINVDANTMIEEPIVVHILPKDGGSTEAESVIYIMLKNMTVIELHVEIAVTDQR